VLDGSAPAIRVHARREEDAEQILAELPSVMTTAEHPVPPVPLVLDRIGFDQR
jgi:hypothetical protein